jgi:hypothetical protein
MGMSRLSPWQRRLGVVECRNRVQAERERVKAICDAVRVEAGRRRNVEGAVVHPGGGVEALDV